MTTLHLLIFWIGLGGMAAGYYHDNTTLTVAMAALFVCGHRYLAAAIPIVTLVSTQPETQNDKNNTDK